MRGLMPTSVSSNRVRIWGGPSSFGNRSNKPIRLGGSHPPDAFDSVTARSSHGLLNQNAARVGSELRQSRIVAPRMTGVTSHRRQYANVAAFCFDSRLMVIPRAKRLNIQIAPITHQIRHAARNRSNGPDKLYIFHQGYSDTPYTI